MYNLFLDTIFCNECNGAFGIGAADAGIPLQIVKLVSMAYNIIRIGVPIILIIVGMYDLGRAVTLKSEDEIKKSQNLLVRKAVSAALVFLVVSLVGVLFSIVSEEKADDSSSIWKCVDSLLAGKCSNAG